MLASKRYSAGFVSENKIGETQMTQTIASGMIFQRSYTLINDG